MIVQQAAAPSTPEIGRPFASDSSRLGIKSAPPTISTSSIGGGISNEEIRNEPTEPN